MKISLHDSEDVRAITFLLR